MEITDPLVQNDLTNDKLRNILIFYSDSIVRSVIALGISLIIVSFVRYVLGWNLPIWFLLVIMIMISITISPLLNRIRLAHLWVDKYMIFLNNIAFKLQKRRNKTQ